MDKIIKILYKHSFEKNIKKIFVFKCCNKNYKSQKIKYYIGDIMKGEYR